MKQNYRIFLSEVQNVFSEETYNLNRDTLLFVQS